ncbi:MAG: substrate-binding domain-containing protein [Solirubrobacterales bacterium]
MNTIKRKIITVIVASLAAVLLVGPASANAATANLTGSGSVAFSAYLVPIFKKYKQITKGKVNVTFNVKSGDLGVQDLKDGKADFAANARAPIPGSALDTGTAYIPTVRDGLGIVVNSANKVKKLSLQQVQDIYLGKIKNWSEVGGADLAITTSGRDTAAGQYGFFTQVVLGSTSAKKVNPAAGYKAFTLDTLVLNNVAADPGAIGFAGQGFIKASKKYKSIALSSFSKPKKYFDLNEANVSKQVYPLWRFLYLVVRTKTLTSGKVGFDISNSTAKLIDWLRYDYDAGRLFRKYGAVPYKQATHPPHKKKKK